MASALGPTCSLYFLVHVFKRPAVSNFKLVVVTDPMKQSVVGIWPKLDSYDVMRGRGAHITD